MAAAKAGGFAYSHYLLMAVVVVGVVTAGLAYHNGFFGAGATTDQPTAPDGDGAAPKSATP